MKKLKKYKVGLNSETFAISLVEEPAMEEELIALEKQEPIKIQFSNDEKHLVYSAVLIPDKPIYRINDKGDEYYLEFSKESIEKMAYEFQMNYKQSEITINHKDNAPEVTVVETWLKADMHKDKSVALGLNENLPIGTWFAAMKVNNIDVWDKIKNGELKGFSVESLISLEEFNKTNNNTMDNIIDDMGFWKKLKETIMEVFSSKEVDVETSEANKITTVAMEANDAPNDKVSNDAPVEEVKDEPTVNDVPNEENNDTPVENEKPSEDNQHIKDLIENLKAEIEALKGYNAELKDKVKELGKQPSTKPTNVNSTPTNDKGVGGTAFKNWLNVLKDLE